MDYLTKDHQVPPRHIRLGDYLVPTEAMLMNQETEELKKYDIYPHITIEGDAILGYSDWVLENDQYVRRPLGTSEEISVFRYKQNVPTTISKRQAKLALLQVGLLDQVPALIAAIEDPINRKIAEIEWESATNIDRNHILVKTLSLSLGLTESALDDLFVLAKSFN
jgi:hypothetical protein